MRDMWEIWEQCSYYWKIQ